jgi:cytochrome P450
MEDSRVRSAEVGTTDTQSLDVDLLLPQFIQDPYPVLARLRVEDPVHWCEPWRMWMITRSDDVRSVLRLDGSLYSAVGQTTAAIAHLPAAQRGSLQPLERLFSAGLLWSDPPDHTRIRAVVNKALSPRDLEQMHPRVEAIIGDALDHLAGGEEFDLIEDFATFVPVTVLAGLLGIPDTDVGRFRSWADTLAAFIGSTRPSGELASRAQACVLEARDYIAWLADQRRAEPGDDVVSRLVADRPSGEALSEDEFQATVIVLLVGGHRTTTALIGNSVLALLQNPDQQSLLRARPDLIRTAVEEFLRYESPHQRTLRVARADTTIADRAIRAGDVVALLNGSANRDPAQFSDPDRLVLERWPNRHLAFSTGVHFCIGAPLARIECAAAVSGILERFSRLELVEKQPTWLENYTLRTLTQLPLRAN